MAPVVPLLEELEKITLDLDEIPKSFVVTQAKQLL